MDFLIHHMLQTSARRTPQKEALVHGQQRLTYGEMARRTTGLAQGLKEGGLRRGDRVGICLEPSAAQALSIFAASEADCVFVPINSLLYPEQVVHIAKDCGMSALITTPAKLVALREVLRQVP